MPQIPPTGAMPQVDSSGLAPLPPPGAIASGSAADPARPSMPGPVGTTRNPVLVLVLGMLCFVYGLIQLFQMVSELKDFRRKDDIHPILVFVPVLGLIEMWRLPEKVLDAKRQAGASNPEVVHPILYLLLGLYFLPVDLNQIWEATGRGPSLPPAR